MFLRVGFTWLLEASFFSFSKIPVFFVFLFFLISQQISGVTIHFRRIQIYRRAGKESATLPGPIIGISRQERHSGNDLSPSQWTSRALGKGHLAL